MASYLDLHSHVLPGLDDGARDDSQSRNLLSLLSSLGFNIVCATPHQKSSQFLPSAAQIADGYNTARGLAAQGQELLLGAENFWDEVFLERTKSRQVPCYTGGRAFLVEVPPDLLPPRFEETLFSYRAKGLLPVLAHPERYRELASDLDRAAAVGKTAALVIDLGALDGAHGHRESRFARKLVLEGLAVAAASDVHTEEDVRAVAAGIAWIERKLGRDRVVQLLEENPRRILQGELPGE